VRSSKGGRNEIQRRGQIALHVQREERESMICSLGWKNHVRDRRGRRVSKDLVKDQGPAGTSARGNLKIGKTPGLKASVYTIESPHCDFPCKKAEREIS